MATLTDFLTGIANKLRSNLGTTGNINAAQFGAKIDEVYSKSTSDFWELYQCGGTRSNYEYAFGNTNFEYIRPKYKITPTTRTVGMFDNCRYLKKIEAAYFDFTNASMANGNYAVFRMCPELIEIEDVKMQAGNYYQTFRACPKLETVAVLRVAATNTFDTIFYGDAALKNITISGTIGQNGLSFADCLLLTTTSIDSIFAALSTTATGKTITFGLASKTAYNNAKGVGAWDALCSAHSNWSYTLI